MSDFLDAEQTARELFLSMQTASLGTLSESGAPLVTLVTAAPCSGDVVLLLSRLALHSQNLRRDPRCSVLLTASANQHENPLAAPRLTIVGSAVPIDRGEDQTEREAFLDCHQSAEMYADFGDFAFYRLEPQTGHLVGGFGQVATLKPSVFDK